MSYIIADNFCLNPKCPAHDRAGVEGFCYVDVEVDGKMRKTQFMNKRSVKPGDPQLICEACALKPEFSEHLPTAVGKPIYDVEVNRDFSRYDPTKKVSG